MSTITSTTAVSVFSNQADADAAISALHHAGFTSSEIGVVRRNVAGTTTATKGDLKTTEAATTDTEEGGLVGAVAGAGIGGLIGAGVLAGVIPVIGPALFAGTLGVLASNAAGGAAVAGIVGALAGWGVPEADATYYESEVVSGKTVVTVTSSGRYSEACAILKSHGGSCRNS